jgi:hypothetical protein
MSFVNPNPNEPRYPYGGGSDNPGDNTAVAGGPSDFVATETGAPKTAVLHPAIPRTIAQFQEDTVLPGGTLSVPLVAAGLEGWIPGGETDPAGGVSVNPVTGYARVHGQNETQGQMGSVSGMAPPAFPEPNP